MLCIARLCALVFTLSTPLVAFAQDTARSEQAAKQHFEEGLRLAELQHWVAALEHFERSFELNPTDKTLINIALCEEKAGRWVDAEKHYAQLQKSTTLSSSIAAEVKAQRQKLRQKIPRLVLELSSRSRNVQVAVDEEPVEVNGERIMMVDPGKHDVRIMRGEKTLSVQSVSANAGERTRLVLAVPVSEEPLDEAHAPPRDVDGPLRQTAEDTEDDGTVFEQWWFWTAVGVVVVGSTVALAVALSPTCEVSDGCVP